MNCVRNRRPLAQIELGLALYAETRYRWMNTSPCSQVTCPASNWYHQRGQSNRCVNPFWPEALGGRDFSTEDERYALNC
jgi:hypothetical protein